MTYSITYKDGIPIKIEILKKVNKNDMLGDNDLEKELNAYLTNQFIGTNNLPADECLKEAREVIAILKKYYNDLPNI